MMNDYKIKNILESLKEEVENGKVSLREAAVELHKAGWTNFIDIDATRNLLKTRNVTGNGNVPGVSDMMGKYREMKAAHPDALYIFRNGESCELYEDDAIRRFRHFGHCHRRTRRRARERRQGTAVFFS